MDAARFHRVSDEPSRGADRPYSAQLEGVGPSGMGTASAWLLEADEDNRELELQALAAAGLAVAAFASPQELIAGRIGAEPPVVAVVDAWTAQSYERQVRGVVSPARLVVLTTSQHLEETWRALGAACVLYKPFALPALCDAVVAAARPVR